jgi:hypothetical protein
VITLKIPKQSKFSQKRKISLDIRLCSGYTLNLIQWRYIFFAVLFCGKCFAIISIKPYKIRNLTMKNLVENASENSVKSQMLKWASEGGGGSM